MNTPKRVSRLLATLRWDPGLAAKGLYDMPTFQPKLSKAGTESFYRKAEAFGEVRDGNIRVEEEFI